MALSEHVSLTITAATLGVARQGFGIPLILSVNAAFSERVRSYRSIEDVAADFATATPEYLAANALFSQQPHPEVIMIGRAVGKPTMRYKITASIVEHSHTYKLQVQGPGITTTTVTYPADSATSDAEIAGGLVTALNAVVGKNYTASGSSSPISVTGTAAGDWFSIESLEPAYLKIEMDHAEPGTTIAADLTAIRAESDAWYMVYTLYNSDACVKATAAAIEAITDSPKMYAADINHSEAATLADGNGDTLDDLQGLNYDRTFVTYHPSPYYMNGAAWMGTRLPYTPGAATWKFARPSGVPAVNATSTHSTNLVTKNGNFLQTTAGVDIMREGKTVGGEFIDTIRDIDWLKDEVSKSIFEVLANATKVPMTNAGIAMIENALRGALLRAVSAGVIDSDFTISVPKVLDVSLVNRAIRNLPDVKFSARLQGAIHKVTVTGVISV